MFSISSQPEAATEGTAVVLGGSMAGLTAAGVLAGCYRQVTVVDRDDLSLQSAQRRGVPQGAHAHALLARGQQALEQLFPGLTEQLIADGATSGDPLAQARLHFSGHRLRRGRAGLWMLSISRPFLESHVRARVREIPNVVFAPPCDIVGVETTADATRVTGASVFPRHGSVNEIIAADLVVDATGRGSRLPRWLEELGYERPPEERVGVDVGYATCCYRLPPDALGGDWGSLQGPNPTNVRGGALARLENDEWMLTLMGMLGDHPPTDGDGFGRFAASLTYPDIAGAIRGADPVGDITAHRFPADVRRRYERLSRFPDGLLVLGDAVCSFNPVYGQGMTVAALQAQALGAHLRRHGVAQPRGFLREISGVVDTPWEMAVGADLAFPEVVGRRTRKRRVLGRYIARLHAAAAHDDRLGAAFMRVSGLVDPPQALLRPHVVARVMRHSTTAARQSSEQVRVRDSA